MLFVEKGMRYARNMAQDNFEYHHFEQNISVLRKFKYKYLLFINKNFIFKSNMIDMLYTPGSHYKFESKVEA